jgi:hypothetical protein
MTTKLPPKAEHEPAGGIFQTGNNLGCAGLPIGCGGYGNPGDASMAAGMKSILFARLW